MPKHRLTYNGTELGVFDSQEEAEEEASEHARRMSDFITERMYGSDHWWGETEGGSRYEINVIR